MLSAKAKSFLNALKKVVVMKHTLLYIILILLILISLSSCGSHTAKHSSQPAGIETRLPEKDTGSPHYYYMLSQLNNKKSELPEAIYLLKKAIDKDPESIFLKKELINLYLELENFDSAIEYAEEILKTNPDNVDILFTLAMLKIKKDKNKEAKKIYNKILELEPENKNIYLLLGKIYNKENNSDKSFKLYSKMIEHFPDSYIAHYYLGMAYLDQNKLNYAEEEFLKTIELSPELIEPRLRLIDIYTSRTKNQKKVNKKIINTYKEMLEIEEHNDFVLMEYALYLHGHGSEKEAEKIFFDFGKKSAEDEKFLLRVANEYIVKKRFKESSVIFFEMLKASPENSSMIFFCRICF
jgi:tetratricopeptide (TPR) repeat protein